MVLIHYKKTEHNQFIVEVPTTTPIEDLIQLLVEINNIRIEIDLFACGLEDLATHGPLKPEQIRGLSSQDLIDNALVLAPEQKKRWALKPEAREGQRFNEDKTHYRTGIILNEQLTQMLIDTSNKAKKMISYKNAEQKQLTSLKDLREMVGQMCAALQIAYPNYEGLGAWETAVELAEKRYNLEQRNTNTIDYLDPKESTLWAVGKQYHKGKKLMDYIGKNEKTKIIVKLTKQGSGAPMRQPAISKETEAQLMAKWHRKQEEMKKLQSNNEDDYMNSQWANPNNLKNQLLTGGRDIQWRAGRK